MWWADSTEANSGPTLGIVRGRPAAGLRDLVAEVAGAEPDGALARGARGCDSATADKPSGTPRSGRTRHSQHARRGPSPSRGEARVTRGSAPPNRAAYDLLRQPPSAPDSDAADPRSGCWAIPAWAQPDVRVPLGLHAPMRVGLVDRAHEVVVSHLPSGRASSRPRQLPHPTIARHRAAGRICDRHPGRCTADLESSGLSCVDRDRLRGPPLQGSKA